MQRASHDRQEWASKDGPQEICNWGEQNRIFVQRCEELAPTEEVIIKYLGIIVEISHGGNIYTMKIDKCYKSGLLLLLLSFLVQ